MLNMLPFKLHDLVLVISGLVVGLVLNVNVNINNVSTAKKGVLPSIAAGCPSGWKDTSVLTGSVVSRTCTQGDWAVVLNEGGICEHGRRMNPPEAKWVACLEVPGWPGN